MVQRIREPIDRLVLRLVLDPPIKDLFSSDAVFWEEALMLEQAAGDAFLEGAAMQTVAVADGLRVMDLIKFRRFFDFASTMIFQALDQAPLVDREGLDARSRIGVFSHENLITWLSPLLGPDVARRAIAQFSFDPAGRGNFDIQYTPFLKLGDYYMVPMAVLCSSDILRNTMYLNAKQRLPSGYADPMLTKLRDAFSKNGFQVADEVKGKFQGEAIEVDLMAHRDGHLILIEGKNSFHPCGVHEMRTSHEHLTKAGRQLTRIQKWLAMPSQLDTVFRNLGWGVPGQLTQKTCAVTANRLFNGYAFDGHPARQVRELLNVLQTGVVDFNGENYRFWGEASFTMGDLSAYLDGTVLIDDCFACMHAVGVPTTLNGKQVLQTESFGLNMEELRTIIVQRYVQVPPTDDSPNCIDGSVA